MGGDHHEGVGVGLGMGTGVAIGTKDNTGITGHYSTNTTTLRQPNKDSQSKNDFTKTTATYNNAGPVTGPVKLPVKFPVKWEIAQSNDGGRGLRGPVKSVGPSIAIATIDDAVQWVIQRHVPPLIGKLSLSITLTLPILHV